MLTALIQAVSAGDEAALTSLYDATSARVFGLALRLLGDRQEAEEVTLDVFHQVWRDASRYSLQRGSPLAWLLMIARSRALDRLRAGARRRNHQRPLDDALAGEASCDDGGARLEGHELLQRALALLPAAQRQVLELAYFKGLSQSQVAEQLAVPLGTVKTRARRGLMQLRETMDAPSDAPASKRKLS